MRRSSPGSPRCGADAPAPATDRVRARPARCPRSGRPRIIRSACCRRASSRPQMNTRGCARLAADGSRSRPSAGGALQRHDRPALTVSSGTLAGRPVPATATSSAVARPSGPAQSGIAAQRASPTSRSVATCGRRAAHWSVRRLPQVARAARRQWAHQADRGSRRTSRSTAAIVRMIGEIMRQSHASPGRRPSARAARRSSRRVTPPSQSSRPLARASPADASAPPAAAPARNARAAASASPISSVPGGVVESGLAGGIVRHDMSHRAQVRGRRGAASARSGVTSAAVRSGVSIASRMAMCDRLRLLGRIGQLELRRADAGQPPPRHCGQIASTCSGEGGGRHRIARSARVRAAGAATAPAPYGHRSHLLHVPIADRIEQQLQLELGVRLHRWCDIVPAVLTPRRWGPSASHSSASGIACIQPRQHDHGRAPSARCVRSSRATSRHRRRAMPAADHEAARRRITPAARDRALQQPVAAIGQIDPPACRRSSPGQSVRIDFLEQAKRCVRGARERSGSITGPTAFVSRARRDLLDRSAGPAYARGRPPAAATPPRRPARRRARAARVTSRASSISTIRSGSVAGGTGASSPPDRIEQAAYPLVQFGIAHRHHPRQQQPASPRTAHEGIGDRRASARCVRQQQDHPARERQRIAAMLARSIRRRAHRQRHGAEEW